MFHLRFSVQRPTSIISLPLLLLLHPGSTMDFERRLAALEAANKQNTLLIRAQASTIARLSSENEAQQTSSSSLSSAFASLSSENEALKTTVQDQDCVIGVLVRASSKGGFWVWESEKEGIKEGGRWCWSLVSYFLLHRLFFFPFAHVVPFVLCPIIGEVQASPSRRHSNRWTSYLPRISSHRTPRHNRLAPPSLEPTGLGWMLLQAPSGSFETDLWD